MGNAYERALLKQVPVWMTGAPVVAAARARDAEDPIVKAAISMRCPAFAPTDARYHLGYTRALEQAPGESAADFIERCGRAHDIWYWAGTKRGMQELFVPLVVETSDVYYLADWDTEFALGGWWSRTWLVIDSREGPWGAPADCDSGASCDAGLMCDISMLEAEYGYIKRQMRQVKSAGAYPCAIWFCLDPDAVYCDIGLECDAGLDLDGGTLDEPLVPIMVWHLFDEHELILGDGSISCDSGVNMDDF